MSKLDDLHTLEKLLKEFEFPVSPILEYAIKERKSQYAVEENIVNVVQGVMSDAEEENELGDYEKKFANLSVGVVNGKKLPHKAILILGIMKLIEEGQLTENKIELDKKIANAFSFCWKCYFSNLKLPSIWIPFWYLKSESFWHFRSNGNEDLLHGLLQFAGHPSVGQMRPIIKYAYLDNALFNYMTKDDSRDKLRVVLLKNYIE